MNCHVIVNGKRFDFNTLACAAHFAWLHKSQVIVNSDQLI